MPIGQKLSPPTIPYICMRKKIIHQLVQGVIVLINLYGVNLMCVQHMEHHFMSTMAIYDEPR